MTQPHKLTLGQAAELTGKSKSTISRAIDAGKLSANRESKDAPYEIDPAELSRVFPFQPATVAQPVAQNGTQLSGATPESSNNVQALAVEIQLLRERIADKDGVIADLRQDRDHWREQAERTTRLLPPPPPETPPVAAPALAERPKRRWWQLGRAND